MNSKNFSVALLIILLTSYCSQSYPTFDEYVHDFNKTYPSQQERQRRKQIYQNRVSMFAEITEYTPGVNNLTDWTHEEINALKNYKPQRTEPMPDSSEYQSSQQNNGKISVGNPSSLDWRTSKAVTSVKTQGSCGSCWAFSVAAYVESKLIIQKGYGIGTDLSQQYLVSCTSGSDCSGGYAQDAMQVVAKNGIPYQSSFPYDPYGIVSERICSTENKVTQAGNRARWLRDVTDARIISLLQQGPLVISISAKDWEFYSGGVFKCPPNSSVDHGVLLVGYTPNQWIVKNQWGRSWGESGYIRISRSRIDSYTNCFIGNLVTYMDPVKTLTSFSHSITYCAGLLAIILIFILT